VFGDDSRQWPEHKGIEKFEFLLPTTVLGYLGVVLATMIVVIPQMADAGERNLELGVIALSMLLPWAPCFLRRQIEIRNLIARFERRKSLQEGIQIILPE
jgi:hypothetical protein